MLQISVWETLCFWYFHILAIVAVHFASIAPPPAITKHVYGDNITQQ